MIFHYRFFIYLSIATKPAAESSTGFYKNSSMSEGKNVSVINNSPALSFVKSVHNGSAKPDLYDRVCSDLISVKNTISSREFIDQIITINAIEYKIASRSVIRLKKLIHRRYHESENNLSHLLMLKLQIKLQKDAFHDLLIKAEERKNSPLFHRIEKTFYNLIFDKNHSEWKEFLTACQQHVDSHVTFANSLTDAMNYKSEVIDARIEYLKTAGTITSAEKKKNFKKGEQQLHPSNEQRPSQKAIALAYRYIVETGEGEGLSEHNVVAIAKDFKYLSKTSGKQILDDYNHWADKANRLTFVNKNQKSIKLNRIKEAMELLQKYFKSVPKSIGKANDEFLSISGK